MCLTPNEVLLSATQISAFMLINKLVIKPRMRNNRGVVKTIDHMHIYITIEHQSSVRIKN